MDSDWFIGWLVCWPVENPNTNGKLPLLLLNTKIGQMPKPFVPSNIIVFKQII